MGERPCLGFGLTLLAFNGPRQFTYVAYGALNIQCVKAGSGVHQWNLPWERLPNWAYVSGSGQPTMENWRQMLTQPVDQCHQNPLRRQHCRDQAVHFVDVCSAVHALAADQDLLCHAGHYLVQLHVLFCRSLDHHL